MAVGKGAGNRTGAGTGAGAGKRRIWEFQPSTTCRVLGLSFDEKELKKIFKDLKLSHDNPYPTAFKMHQHLVQVCGTQNHQHAKRIEKILDRQFAAYKNKPGIAEPLKICDFIEGNNGAEAGGDTFKDVPISALIWFAARNNVTDKTNGNGNSKEIETRIYTALHLREHQALRFYDELSRKLPGGKAENVMNELDEKGTGVFKGRTKKAEPRKRSVSQDFVFPFQRCQYARGDENDNGRRGWQVCSFGV